MFEASQLYLDDEIKLGSQKEYEEEERREAEEQRAAQTRIAEPMDATPPAGNERVDSDVSEEQSIEDEVSDIPGKRSGRHVVKPLKKKASRVEVESDSDHDRWILLRIEPVHVAYLIPHTDFPVYHSD